MMKATIVILSMVMWGSFSQAQMIADLFECKTKIVDLKTNSSAESVGLAAGHRIVTPIDANTGEPYPSDIEVTQAQAKVSLALNGQKNTYKVDLNLHYGFARSLVGNSTDARQFVCHQVSLQSCQGDRCSVASNICMIMPDPFDPAFGWSVTGLIQNVPTFNEQLLHPFDTIIPADENDPNGAHVTVSCKLQGTYF